MKVITETELREIYKKSPFTSFDLPKGMKLTPAASQFLSERKIQVLRDGVAESELYRENRQYNIAAPTPAFPKQPPTPQPLSNATKPAAVKLVNEDTTAKNMNTANVSLEKPEHMTHIRGSQLVPKTHPVITYRGKLDTFEAVLLNTVIDTEMAGFKGLANDLQELLAYAREMMRAEVMAEPLSPVAVCGWDCIEIRDRSHNPNKYYGVNHFTPQPEHGKIMAQLNFLRTQARELELAAVRAFIKENGATERDDILLAVNRISSIIYVFMLQLLAGVYKYGN